MALFTDQISAQATRIVATGIVALGLLCAACTGPNLALQQAQRGLCGRPGGPSDC
jgi:hypothetical protein